MALIIDTLFVGHTHIHVPVLVSTNTYTQELLAGSETAEGTVVTAGYQTSGRGQIGRSWHSSPDQNILTSIVLKPAFVAAVDQFQLSIAISIALQRVVSQYLPERVVTIKWPNDIYVDDQKIAGILIQNSLKGSSISSSIVGIGLNVNEVSWPKEIPNPTSLAKELGEPIDKTACLSILLTHIEQQYLTLKASKEKQQRQEYTALLYQRGVQASYSEKTGNIITGTITGVDEKGRLVIDLENEVKHYQFREIAYL